MVFFVAIHQEAWPDRLDELLTTIRRSLAAARTLHPGRRSTRLFQRLGEPTRLLALSEWVTEEAFEEFRRWSVFVETIAACGPPPRVEPLTPLRRFERMDQRVAVAACGTITVSAAQAPAVQDYLLGEAHGDVTHSDGFVSREIYRSRDSAGRLLVVNGWRSLADLDRFETTYSRHRGEPELTRLGATLTRFTGALAAEYSVARR